MTAIVQPVRLQLSRRKGFSLQALSRATNGLEAVNVARPSRWANGFRIGDLWEPKRGVRVEIKTRLHARTLFMEHVVAFELRRAMMLGDGAGIRGSQEWLRDVGNTLVGKNLACWCPLNEPCHADVWLCLARIIELGGLFSELANR